MEAQLGPWLTISKIGQFVGNQGISAVTHFFLLGIRYYLMHNLANEAWEFVPIT